jgi:hypothetical protein
MIVYTRPPYPHYMYDAKTAYPYILVNAYSEAEALRYVNQRSSRFIKSVLLDSGVHSVFHTQKLQEYPGGYQNWIAKVVRLWTYIASLVADSYAVVPDYPADYEDNEVVDNVERTLRNIEYAVKKHPHVKWIIPLQGKKDDVVSVVKSFEYVRDLGLLERYNYIAIAPTCTTRNVKFLRDVAVVINRRVKQLKNRQIKIHMFGVTMKAWREIAPFVDSTDAIVTNMLCLSAFGKMCTTAKEKEEMWNRFLEKVASLSSARRP